MVEQLIEIQPELTGIALAYRNKLLIADEIFPEVKVSKKSFQYRAYNKESFLTVPNIEIGEKGSPNEARLESKLVSETCRDYALKEKVPVARMEEVKDINLEQTVTMQLTDLLKLGREVKLAAKLSDSDTYGDNVLSCSDAQKVSNEECNAVDLVWSGMDKVIFKPNTMIMGRRAYSSLRRNPYVVSAVKGAYVKAGVASYEGLRDLFEVDKILVGEGLVNTAAKGKTPKLSYCWGDNIILMYINPVAGTDYGITMGYKAVLDSLQVGSYVDPDAGTKGCEVLKVFETYIDLITCPECGYIFKGVL